MAMEMGKIDIKDLEEYQKNDLLESFLNYCTYCAKYCIQENICPNDLCNQSKYFEQDMEEYYKGFSDLKIDVKRKFYNLFVFYVKKQYEYMKVIENIYKE